MPRWTGVRAALTQLRAPARTPIALYGYSGGSVPTGFGGAELAPAYSPELNIIGAAAGGIPVDPAHNLGYINGKPEWTGVIPALMAVYAETYDIDLAGYLSPKGERILRQVAGECIEQFADEYPPGLTDRQLLEPGGGRSARRPRGGAAGDLEKRDGNARHAAGSMMLGVGNSDGIGDGVMVAADVAGLARSYRSRGGVPTTFTEYRGQTHTAAFIPWSIEALAFVNDRFAGR